MIPTFLDLQLPVAARKNLPMWASLDPLEYLPHAHVNTHKKFALGFTHYERFAKFARLLAGSSDLVCH
jgi:hypothetical protein